MTDNGGSSPNVVPAHAEVIYLMRSRTSEKVARLYERICKIAQGAALMTETELSVTFDKACSNLTSNSVLEELLYQTMQQVGVPAYTQEDWDYAQRFTKTITPADLESDQVLGLYHGVERAEILQKLKERPIADFICPHHHSEVMMLGSSEPRRSLLPYCLGAIAAPSRLKYVPTSETELIKRDPSAAPGP